MIDVFTEEIEVQIKLGISNLYWYKGDLKKCWLRVSVDERICGKLFVKTDFGGQRLTKRQLMDELYSILRTLEYNRRLEISRNFVRVLIEHQNFVPHNENHRIEIAERCSLKLRKIMEKQKKQAEYRETIKKEQAKQKNKIIIVNY